ncbi:MAG: PQQ-binding-like beta-propeller repeat protein [Candidatus Omnitrophota bacterium]
MNRNQRHSYASNGLTLIEVIFVVAIMGIILATVSLAFRGSFRSWDTGIRRTELIQKGRVALDLISREIRTAHNFGRLSDAANLYYTDSNGVFKRFEIDLDNHVLHYGPVGSPLADLVAPIGDQSQFTYYPEDGVTQTTMPSKIRSVLATLEISDPDGSVNNMVVSSRVKRRRDNQQLQYRNGIQGLGITDELINPLFLASRWQANLICDLSDSSAVVDEDMVFTGCTNQNITAIDADTGAILWATFIGNDLNSPLAIDGDYLYVAAGREAYAYDKIKGELIWSVPPAQRFDGEVNHSAPVIYGDSVYITAGESVYRLNKNTGQRIWQSPRLNQTIEYVTPVILDNVLYVMATRSIFAISLTDGSLFWGAGGSGASGPLEYVEGSREDQQGNRTLKFDIINRSEPPVPIQVISLVAEYVGGAHYNEVLWNGLRVWRSLIAPGNGSGSVANFTSVQTINPGETVPISMRFDARIDQVEFKISSSDGSVIIVPVIGGQGGSQPFQSSPSVYYNPILGINVVYSGNNDRYVYAYDAQAGAQLWQSDRLSGSVQGSPAISIDGTYIYVGAGRYVHKLSTADGRDIGRSQRLDRDILSALVLSGQYVYVSAGDYAYVIDETSGNIVQQSPNVGRTQYFSPTIANGMIFIGSNAGRLLAYGL